MGEGENYAYGEGYGSIMVSDYDSTYIFINPAHPFEDRLYFSNNIGFISLLFEKYCKDFTFY